MRILVAEDDRVMRLVLETRLRKMGHTVVVAEDGESAWEIYRDTSPNLVITDWMMPRLTGPELCMRIRNNQSGHYTFVILLTALAERFNYVEGMKAGADDFLTKPVDMEELNARLRVAERILALQTEVVARNNELEKALANLKTMQGALVQSEKLASLGQLTAGIAHEINNPMAFVISNLNRFEEYFHDLDACYSKFAEFIARLRSIAPYANQAEELFEFARTADVDFLRSDFVRLMQQTRSGTERITTIVAQLRGFAAVNQSTIEEADINLAIEDTLAIAANELKHKATIRKELGDIPPVECNIQELKQVFLNLIVNAAHAIKESGTITLQTASRDSQVIIKVSDTGTGIAPEHLPKIFDPFFTTKPIGTGTGLGLWICSTLVQKHNGLLEVESAVGRGTTMTITLPIRQTKERTTEAGFTATEHAG